MDTNAYQRVCDITCQHMGGHLDDPQVMVRLLAEGILASLIMIGVTGTELRKWKPWLGWWSYVIPTVVLLGLSLGEISLVKGYYTGSYWLWE